MQFPGIVSAKLSTRDNGDYWRGSFRAAYLSSVSSSGKYIIGDASATIHVLARRLGVIYVCTSSLGGLSMTTADLLIKEQQFSVWQKWAFIEQITDYQIGLKKDQESISLPIAEAEGLISERKAGSTAQKKVSGGICSEFRIDMGTGTRRSAYAIEEWIRKVQGCFKAYRRCARRFIPQGLQAPAL